MDVRHGTKKRADELNEATGGAKKNNGAHVLTLVFATLRFCFVQPEKHFISTVAHADGVCMQIWHAHTINLK